MSHVSAAGCIWLDGGPWHFYKGKNLSTVEIIGILNM